MVNIKMWYHPKKYKELHGLTSRKCNTRQRAQGSLPANGALNSDQAISLRARDGECERTPGSGLKLQAQCDSQEALQSQSRASSVRHQALKLSNQPQASSAKIPEPGNK